jgi:HAD superfamily hydrolase (TIGR01544 family)
MDGIREFVKDPLNHVRIKDVTAFEIKIQALLDGGRKSVHLISDFDMTLTKYWVDGKRSVSSHGILERYSRLDAGFKDKVAALYSHYYPLEVSHSLDMSQKIKYMEEWWSKAHELIIQQGLSKKDLSLMVQETSVEFRPGMQALIDLISKENIPLLIFSAGIGDIILEILTQAKLFNPAHMHIVSNRLGWNSEGVCDHFDGKLIHVFNKNESSVTDPTYRDLLLHRQNVVRASFVSHLTVVNVCRSSLGIVLGI